MRSPLRKATIIPIIKDEGADGDRDFLQWDRVSLMSLLNVYTIISYYDSATKNSGYRNKITCQAFDTNHLRTQLSALRNIHSSAVHWNSQQCEHLKSLG